MGLLLTMDQGALLHPHLSLHSEYGLSTEHDFNDHIPGHAQHQTYANAVVDQFRRDGNLAQQPQSSFTFAATNNGHGPRFVPDRTVAPDGSYQTANHFTYSSSGSISASPSSAASSLAYTNYPPSHYTNVPTFPGPVQLPQSFFANSYAGSRVPSMLEGSVPCMLPPPSRSPLSPSSNATERESYIDAKPSFLARSQLSPSSQAAYTGYSETSRGVLSAAALSLSPTSGGYPSHMSSSNGHGYGSQQNECSNFPWPELQVLQDMTCEGQAVTPEVRAKIEKGFFMSPTDQKWTCYRRNYFAVNCSFELHPHIANGRMQLKNGSTIQAMGVKLSAAVDGPQGKPVELVQHTPKRDNGPKNRIEIQRVSPTPPMGRQTAEHTISPHGVYQVPIPTFHATGVTPGPYLPLQTASDSSSTSSSGLPTPQSTSQYPYTPSAASHIATPGQSLSYSFERIQFKSATANNGKRRASQQYFHLIVELYADVQREGEGKPNWVKVAQRLSEKIVVRGRSPSHYQNEGQHGGSSSAGRGGSTSAGGNGYSAGMGSGYSSINSGGFRSSTGGYNGSVSSSGGYRTNQQYGFHPSPDHPGSQSDSGASSVSGGAMDTDHPMDSGLSETEQADIMNHDGYQYYPSTIYEGLPAPNLPSLRKVETAARFTTEPQQYAVKAEYNDAVPGTNWQLGNCGRFQGMETSRGYYPDLHASY